MSSHEIQQDEQVSYVFKPFDHPVFMDEETGSMSDADYERGITFNTVQMKTREGEDTKRFSITVSNGMTTRGGRDFVIGVLGTKDTAIESFLNQLVIMIGVGGFSMHAEQPAKLIQVPTIQYRKQFLPPYVAMVRITAEAKELLQKYLPAEDISVVPDYTLVLYDSKGNHPLNDDYDTECCNQIQFFDFDLDELEEYHSDERDTSTELQAYTDDHAIYSAQAQHLGLISADQPITADIRPNIHDSGTAMDLHSLAGGDIELSVIEKIKEEDAMWDDEVNKQD